MSSDGNDGGGYGKPPPQNRFKKGQSGCPDGGWAKKRAKKAEREKAAREKAHQKAKELRDLIRRVALEEHSVSVNNRTKRMTTAEIVVRNALHRGMKKDASDRHVKQAIALLEKAKLLEPAPEKGKSGVLVVYPIRTEEEWEKATEGELLPRDPLHGIPGAEGLLEANKKLARPLPPEDDDV